MGAILLGGGSTITAAEGVRHQDDMVAQMKTRFTILMLPELIPLTLMTVIHMLPFSVAYLWITLLIALLLYLSILIATACIRRLNLPLFEKVRWQAQLVVLLVQLFGAVYLHISVQVMTRVYAGEWRHGGYFDSLWLHIIFENRKSAQCKFFNFVRVIDVPLRWT